jgi:hypothetical protein
MSLVFTELSYGEDEDGGAYTVESLGTSSTAYIFSGTFVTY